MKTAFIIPAAIALCTTFGCDPGPQPPRTEGTDPIELMRAADSAAFAVPAVEYDFIIEGTDDFAAIVPPFRGTVTAARTPGSDYPVMNVSFTPDTLEDGNILPDLTVACDGDSAWVLDRSAMVLTRGSMESGASDILDFAFYALMIEFLVEGPFQSEISADSIAWEGVDSVSGVPCDVVFVVYEGSLEEVRWYIGQQDHLPRRVERFGDYEDMTGSQILQISDLRILDPAPEAASFRLEDIPAGVQVEDYSSVIEVGSPALDWTLQTPEGESVTLSDLKGNVVVLDFWATWCGPCAQAMPGLQALSVEFQDRPVRIIGVNVWEDGDPAAFMAENGYTYPIVVGGDSVAEDYLVTGIPTFYVIGRDGSVVFASRGYDPGGEQALRSQIEAALSQ